MKFKDAMKAAKKTGKAQVVTEPVEISEVKVSVTIRLDADILNGIKAEGASKAIPYQTLINSILKQHLEKGDFEKRLEKIEKELFSSHG